MSLRVSSIARRTHRSATAPGPKSSRCLRVHAVERRDRLRHVGPHGAPEVDQVGDPVAVVRVEVADARTGVRAQPRPLRPPTSPTEGSALSSASSVSRPCPVRHPGSATPAGIELPAADSWSSSSGDSPDIRGRLRAARILSGGPTAEWCPVAMRGTATGQTVQVTSVCRCRIPLTECRSATPGSQRSNQRSWEPERKAQCVDERGEQPAMITLITVDPSLSSSSFGAPREARFPVTRLHMGGQSRCKDEPGGRNTLGACRHAKRLGNWCASGPNRIRCASTCWPWRPRYARMRGGSTPMRRRGVSPDWCTTSTTSATRPRDRPSADGDRGAAPPRLSRRGGARGAGPCGVPRRPGREFARQDTGGLRRAIGIHRGLRLRATRGRPRHEDEVGQKEAEAAELRGGRAPRRGV